MDPSGVGERGVVSGGGVTVWNGKHMQFDISGMLHWPSRFIALTKMHRGKSALSDISYSGTLLVEGTEARITGRFILKSKTGRFSLVLLR